MLKSLLRRLLASTPLIRTWQLQAGTPISIFFMHRSTIPDLGVSGHDREELARTLAQVRRHHTPILTLQEVTQAVREQRPLPRRAAVFTVDDGYFDFEGVAVPVFAAYDCPVTVFLVTGFLDGTCWLWWDRTRYIFANGDLRAGTCQGV